MNAGFIHTSTSRPASSPHFILLFFNQFFNFSNRMSAITLFFYTLQQYKICAKTTHPQEKHEILYTKRQRERVNGKCKKHHRDTPESTPLHQFLTAGNLRAEQWRNHSHRGESRWELESQKFLRHFAGTSTRDRSPHLQPHHTLVEVAVKVGDFIQHSEQ